MSSTEIKEWPWCDKCSMPAETVIVIPRDHNLSVRYIVKCHGEEESTILTNLDKIKANEISFGKTFITTLMIKGKDKK